MNSDKAQQLIDDYLSGTISAEDMALLRQAKEENDPVMEELKLSKAVVSSLRVNHRMTLKSELTDMLHAREL